MCWHSGHCPRTEDCDPRRGCEQPHRTPGVVQLLLPWQLLLERSLRDQAALDGSDRCGPLRDGENLLSCGLGLGSPPCRGGQWMNNIHVTLFLVQASITFHLDYWNSLLKKLNIGKISVKKGYRSEFHNLRTTDICDQINLCHGGCPVHCRVSSDTPGFYPLNVSSTTHLEITKNASRYCHLSPGKRE